MRFALAIMLGAGVPVSIGAFLACGPPSSFDRITGGVVDAAPEAEAAIPATVDPTLLPPRPKGPLASSWINSARPRFTWELVPGTTGAEVTVCRDASCSGEKKSFPATGAELDWPEDLAPGVWFWHVTSVAPQRIGTTPSVTWTVLVRGGKGKGVAAGSFVDLNGDGIPELLPLLQDPNTPVPYFVPLIGLDRNDPSAFIEDVGFLPRAFVTTAKGRVASGDVDGDGLSDLILTDEEPITGVPTPVPYIYVIPGGRGEEQVFGPAALAAPRIPGLDVVPTLVAGHDFDGDGYGDLALTTKRAGIRAFGAKDGLAVISYFNVIPTFRQEDAGDLPIPSLSFPLHAYDYDSDGLSDIAAPTFWKFLPFDLLLGKPTRAPGFLETELLDGGAEWTPPTSFASGDVDGDGENDLVFAATRAGKPVVCVFSGAQDYEADSSVTCWEPPAPVPPGFGNSLVTADLEGTGSDAILVGSDAGIDVLRYNARVLTPDPRLPGPHGAALTVVWPGRPGPAVWAATETAGGSLAVYRGKEQRLISFPGIKIGPSIR